MTDFQKSFSDCLQEDDGSIFFDEPLKNHCSFHIGGNAELLFVPKNETALIKALRIVNEKKIPFRVLGNGSNVLISDVGLRGIVIKLANGLNDIIYLGDGVILCSAGVSLSRLCNFALERSLAGLEFAYGIPGSVGGAIYMNAGAYGGEIKDALVSVRSVDSKNGEIHEEKISELEYSYRNTSFMKNDRIITAGYFRLKQGDEKEISEKMNCLLAKRRTSQPLEYPSAGSIFKRPAAGYAAAYIDLCGLKGLKCGGAEVSAKHAGFIINKDNATCEDALRLMDKIKKEVKLRFGVELVPEVEILMD